MAPTRLLVAFLVLRTFVLLTASSPGDVRRYYEYTEKRARGLLAYRDFAFEYPPLAYAYLAAPRLLAPRASFEDYHRLFRLQSFLLDLWAFILLAASGAVREELLWAYVAATTFLGPVLYDRLDVALAFLFALAVFLRSRGWIAWACGALGAAGAFKIFGALSFPALVSAEGCTKARKVRELALRSGAFVAGLVLPFLPMACLVGADVFDFLEYHSQRGIQVESTWATLEMALAICLGLPREVVWNGGEPLERDPGSPSPRPSAASFARARSSRPSSSSFSCRSLRRLAPSSYTRGSGSERCSRSPRSPRPATRCSTRISSP